MAKWMRRLVALFLVVSATAAAACSTSDRTDDPGSTGGSKSDGGSKTDAGTEQQGAFVNHATQHESYAPDGYQPTDATRLIVVGDSISAGYGTTKSSYAYYGQLLKNDDAKWPDEMATSLQAKFGHDVEYVPIAVAGAVTDDLPSQQSKIAKMGPFSGHSIVTITIGGNDLQGSLFGGGDPAGAPLTNAIDNIRSFIEFLQDPAMFPDGTSIYLMAVYDPTDGKGQANGCFGGISAPQFIDALDQWRDAYIDLGKEMGFSVIDALGHFHGHGANYEDQSNQYYNADDNTRWFANDCIHPNDRGHSELRRLFYEVIDWSYTATP